jgi:hypothetical protein
MDIGLLRIQNPNKARFAWLGPEPDNLQANALISGFNQ